jgi:hypothetical protein
VSAWSDLPDEMRRPGLDDDTLERLLAGRIDPADAPPGYSEVARVVRAAVASVEDVELLREGEDVAAALGLVSNGCSASTPSHGRSRQTKTLSHRVKLAGVVVLGTLAGSTGLAAAGVLPDPAQDALSGVLERVGISLPASDTHPASSGEEISGIATSTTSTGVAKGAEVSTAASGGVGQAGEHGSGAGGGPAAGSAGGEPQVSAPNEGGTGTADVASGGASENGTDTADAASEGRSEAGSGNASGPPDRPTPSAAPKP